MRGMCVCVCMRVCVYVCICMCVHVCVLMCARCMCVCLSQVFGKLIFDGIAVVIAKDAIFHLSCSKVGVVEGVGSVHLYHASNLVCVYVCMCACVRACMQTCGLRFHAGGWAVDVCGCVRVWSITFIHTRMHSHLYIRHSHMHIDITYTIFTCIDIRNAINDILNTINVYTYVHIRIYIHI